MPRFSPLLLCFLLASPVGAQSRQAPFLVEESQQGFDSLQSAIDSIGEGQGTILVAPGRYRACAVQEAGQITLRAQQAGQVIFDGVACEGKAALVIRGRSASIEGLVFQNIRVPDRNGAGIRLEGGDLQVRDSLFRSGENGILIAADHEGSASVEQSTFSSLGACPEDHGCSHAIYNSGPGSLSVRRSRFEKGTGGHYVKSRGGRIEIRESSFDDSQGRASNYMVDLPDGATGIIADNLFVQGANKENYSAFIMVAAEDEKRSSAGLSIRNNEAGLVPGLSRRTAFVADASGDRLDLADNRLGTGISLLERR